MNKNFYFFAIFFAILTVICGVIQSVVVLVIGNAYGLESFVGWFLATNFVSLIGIVFVLRYYQFKKFRFTFISAIVTTVASLGLSAVFFAILTTQTLQTVYPIVLATLLISSVIYGISLIISPAGKYYWLKISGAAMVILSTVWIATLIWTIIHPEAQRSSSIEQLNQWTSFVTSLLPLLFVKHFSIELRALRQADIIPMNRGTENAIWFIAMVGVLLMLSFGIMMTDAATGTYRWQKSLSIQAEEWNKLFESRTYTNEKGDELHYQLLKPLNFNPQEKYPIVVCLPYGDGVKGAPAAQILLKDFNRQKYPAYIFVPYGPQGSGWGGAPTFEVVDTLVFDAIRTVERELTSIDTTRRYVTGVSLGGYGSWHFIFTRPDMFAAAIPVCGGGDARLASKITNVSVWAFHGAKDKNVPVSGSRDIINEMKNAGGNPQYTEYPDDAHTIWDKVAVTPGLWDWLFAQRQH
jgi:hypothetical protein